MKQKLKQIKTRLLLAYQVLFKKSFFMLTNERMKNGSRVTVTILNYPASECLNHLADAHNEIATELQLNEIARQHSKKSKASIVDVN